MKITKTRLRQIIKEEMQRMEESVPDTPKFVDPSALGGRLGRIGSLQGHLDRAKKDLEDAKLALNSGSDVDHIIDGLEILIAELRAQLERASR